MTDSAEPSAAAPPPKRSRALAVALVATVLLGGGSFAGIYTGLLPMPDELIGGDAAEAAVPAVQAAFVPLDEMVITLGPDAAARHLKVRLVIEVEPGAEEVVGAISPRVMDVMNTFLRAVDEGDFEQPRRMMRLRAQMLRRVRMVAPAGTVRDVLVQEFVLN